MRSCRHNYIDQVENNISCLPTSFTSDPTSFTFYRGKSFYYNYSTSFPRLQALLPPPQKYTDNLSCLTTMTGTTSSVSLHALYRILVSRARRKLRIFSTVWPARLVGYLHIYAWHYLIIQVTCTVEIFGIYWHFHS